MGNMAEAPSAPAWLRRAIAAAVVLAACLLAAFEIAGIVNGFHQHRDRTTVDVSTIIVVQGLLGIPALLAALSASRAIRVLAEPRRHLRPAGLSLAVAIPLAVLYAFMFASAYGS